MTTYLMLSGVLLAVVYLFFLQFQIHSHMSSHEYDRFNVKFTGIVLIMLHAFAFFFTKNNVFFLLFPALLFFLFSPNAYIGLRNELYLNFFKKHVRSYHLEYKLLYFVIHQEKWNALEKAHITKFYYDYLHFYLKKKKSKEDKKSMHDLYDRISTLEKSDLTNNGFISFQLEQRDFNVLRHHIEKHYAYNPHFYDWDIQKNEWNIHNVLYQVHDGVLLDTLLFIQERGNIEDLTFTYQVKNDPTFNGLRFINNQIALLKDNDFVKYLERNDFSEYPEQFKIVTT